MKIIHFTFIFALLLTGCSKDHQSSLDPSHTDTALIQQVIEDYKLSINRFDTLLAKRIWCLSEEVSFIHPRGHEKGWEGIKKGIYEMFGSRFSKRDLKSHNEQITLYGDMAVV